MFKPHYIACLVALNSILAGCSLYSRAHENRSTAKLAVTADQKEMVKSQARLNASPLQELALFLDAANAARLRMLASTGDTVARSDYNFAVARIVEIVDRQGYEPWAAPLVCESTSGTSWRLSLKPPDPRPEYHPRHFRIRPADRYDFRGRLVGERSIKQGLGAPVVVIGKDMDFTKVDQFAQGEQVFYGLTALIRFDGSDSEIVFYDPLEVANVTLDQDTHPLAADFQAPLALSLAELNLERRQLAGMFNPSEHKGSARLARLQPYNPKKIPVICIHGLGNSQATWVPVIEYLRSDPDIRQHYQFWFYSYPSGLPYPLAAAILRNQMDQMRKQYPDHMDLVVIGHSMGGMISRLLLTDSGMTLWNAYYDRPPGDIPFSPETRAVMSSSLIFAARPDISRVLFFSASHRGSDTATSRLGRLGARLVGDPIAEREINQEALAFARPEVRNDRRNRLPNSIDMLDPETRFLALVDSLPMKPGVPYHSIIGDRGRGGNLDRTRPQSTDGVVPYWSSHLEGAASELVIPSKHWSHLHPEGMAEARRILLKHIGIR